MIYECKGCGKKYKIDVENMKMEVGRFRCGVCNEVNTIRKPQPEETQPPPQQQVRETPAPEPLTKKSKYEKVTPSFSHRKGLFLGLRAKMLALFIIVPVALMVLGNLFWLSRMQSLSNLITDESSQVITKMAEESIADKSRAVAREVRLFLRTHPGLKKEAFNSDPEFRKVAMQNIGQTGYTMLVSRPTETEPAALWVYPNKKLVGADIRKAMRNQLGEEFGRWDKIQGKDYETGGYYMWLDKREKYQHSVPVRGTNFSIPGAAYMDEFTLPVKLLKKRADILTKTTLRDVLIILAVATLLISIITIAYATKLSGNIRYMANAADRLSLGEMNVDIELKSKDEIGVLAEAINRMQYSIGMAIERLRQKR
jgi:HAMP domain-containing protein